MPTLLKEIINAFAKKEPLCKEIIFSASMRDKPVWLGQLRSNLQDEKNEAEALELARKLDVQVNR